MFLKFSAQTFEAGDFLNILSRFWGFSGSFISNFSYEQKIIFSILHYLKRLISGKNFHRIISQQAC